MWLWHLEAVACDLQNDNKVDYKPVYVQQVRFEVKPGTFWLWATHSETVWAAASIHPLSHLLCNLMVLQGGPDYSSDKADMGNTPWALDRSLVHHRTHDSRVSNRPGLTMVRTYRRKASWSDRDSNQGPPRCEATLLFTDLPSRLHYAEN